MSDDVRESGAGPHDVRVWLPYHLRILARLEGETAVRVEGPVTPNSVLDALEQRWPELQGTIRDHSSKRRRAYLRYFACEEDLSHESPDDALPERVASGEEPFMVVGAMAGG
ncbi:MoaD/ThiS family protein [Nocardiopsis sp. HNM0947]|uniref:MoaD/ThiS family protein n=1 Tax=Nocardiopsis coralli TaxID=2772213 RepID=A0ABR9P3T8_9ACTN|nr:MoaD/ThiS family protein [Nocardiopsis coralli]MBE2998502.1 MoaD/ThiS family protein [Nocardiopsis coralli]